MIKRKKKKIKIFNGLDEIINARNLSEEHDFLKLSKYKVNPKKKPNFSWNTFTALLQT